MKSKAFLSLLATFVVSIPVATQQAQPQKPQTPGEKESKTVPKTQQPETEEDQDSVVRISITSLAIDRVTKRSIEHFTASRSPYLARA